MKLNVYNLQFPDRVGELVIADHIFHPVDDYLEQVRRLSCHVPDAGELQLTAKTGQHAITATVECPSPELTSPLGWAVEMPVLQDILLLLSLFTGREVFSASPGESAPIVRDSRPLLKCETLGASLPMRLENVDGIPADVGFAEEIEVVLRRVHSNQWLSKFQRGDILFVARQIYSWQVLEKAFLMAYVVWEHLFFVEKTGTLNDKQISDTDGAHKVCFLLEHYGFTGKLNNVQKQKIYDALTRSRNELAHYGLFKTNTNANRDAIKFVELTTRLFTKVLGLQPTDATNSQNWLEKLVELPTVTHVS